MLIINCEATYSQCLISVTIVFFRSYLHEICSNYFWWKIYIWMGFRDQLALRFANNMDQIDLVQLIKLDVPSQLSHTQVSIAALK